MSALALALQQLSPAERHALTLLHHATWTLSGMVDGEGRYITHFLMAGRDEIFIDASYSSGAPRDVRLGDLRHALQQLGRQGVIEADANGDYIYDVNSIDKTITFRESDLKALGLKPALSRPLQAQA